MMHILGRLDDEDCLEVDKIRIWDFYILYPFKTYSITIRRKEEDLRTLRKKYIGKDKNPYEYRGDDRKLFDRLQPYQMTALSSLVSYGIIDKESFLKKEIKVSNRDALNNFLKNTDSLSLTANNTLSFLSIFSKSMTMLGVDGLKNRTHLMESKYDAE